MIKLEINDLIARINDLARKERSQSLEAWEKAEQEALRQEYLTFIRGQVRQTLTKVELNLIIQGVRKLSSQCPEAAVAGP